MLEVKRVKDGSERTFVELADWWVVPLRLSIRGERVARSSENLVRSFIYLPQSGGIAPSDPL
jgi:hypothetical protein